MILDSSLIAVYLIIPAVIGIMGFMFKMGIQSMLSRLDLLEQREAEKITKEEFETAVKDKLEPLKQSVSDLKHSTDRLYALLLKQ